MILAVVLISKLFYFVSLQLPKQIVNDGIRGEVFKKTDSNVTPFMHVTVGPYDWLGMPKMTLLDGFQLDQLPIIAPSH